MCFFSKISIHIIKIYFHRSQQKHLTKQFTLQTAKLVCKAKNCIQINEIFPERTLQSVRTETILQSARTETILH